MKSNFSNLHFQLMMLTEKEMEAGRIKEFISEWNEWFALMSDFDKLLQSMLELRIYNEKMKEKLQ